MTPLEWVGFVFVVILWTVLIDIRDWRRIEAKRAEAFRWAEANGGLSRAQLEAYQATEAQASRRSSLLGRPVVWSDRPSEWVDDLVAHQGLLPARDSAQAEADRLQIARLLEEVGGR